MYYVNHYNSPLGGITLASCGKALTGLWFDGQKYFAYKLNKNFEEKKLDVFDQAITWLNTYFIGYSPDFTPPLSTEGISLFRKKVYEILLKIPFGHTVTYGNIAKLIALDTGKIISAQAVGGAVGHNPISLIIPCHRVIGSNGSLTGYAGGIKKKLDLLNLEGVNIKNLYIPKKGTAL